ncbi:hypothetical protein [Nocardioides sp. Leaf307]|uniref:hypothetical protein n=1 Tax=Nocardioides sp. Leaf307 TaxID=1736331 RepID=UPI000702D02D|nr:hypothetical protein [Nocardioides sp. Leaf307]KQQ43082.1 hypothetical protein ASF50_03550 [Nocardioides sp. Leaf307]
MDLTTQKRAALAAGSVRDLIGLNRGLYGDAQMMARGYNAQADTQRATADGRDLRELFDELTQVATIANESQQRFVDLFTFPVTSPVTSVLQTMGSGPQFEDASEYGVPVSSRAEFSTLDMGVPFKWYDHAWRATWQYLADATETEIAAQAAAIVRADSDHVFSKVMGTVFRNTNRVVRDSRNGSVYDVLAFANGDGWKPPAYEANEFDESHTHYRTTGASTVSSADLDEVITDLKSHGHARENGSQIVIFVNAVEGDTIAGFRVATGAKYDFIPSAGQSFFATDGDLIGQQASATFAGFPVKGSYDEAIIIESTRIPRGYLTALASGGRLNPTNPIMFRQHASTNLQGLRLVGGPRDAYPLQDSYWVRGFGTGVRHRLAGLVMQVTTNATYTAPALYAAV